MYSLCRSVFISGALVAAIAVMLVTVSASPDREWTLTIEPVTSPAAKESSAPQLITADRAILSWMERAGSQATLKMSERTPTGGPRRARSSRAPTWWSTPLTCPRCWLLRMEVSPPHGFRKTVPDSEAYNLKVAWSKDGGATWSAPGSPHHDGTQTQHGFASLFQAPGAGLGLVWLDGRATDPDSPNPTDNMSLRSTTFTTAGKQLRRSRSTHGSVSAVPPPSQPPPKAPSSRFVIAARKKCGTSTSRA